MSRSAPFVGIPAAQIHDREGSSIGMFLNFKEDSGVTAISVAAAASADTKGSWVELIASTTEPANWIQLAGYNATTPSTVDATGLMDIGIGAAGSEVAVVSNIPMGNTMNSDAAPTISDWPVDVPVGSRISARYQCATASRAIATWAATAATPGLRSPSSIDTIGANTTTSAGVALAANDTWTEITSATTQAYRAIAFWCSTDTTSYGQENVTVTFGMGASGSEITLGRYYLFAYLNEQLTQYGARSRQGLVIGHFPKGTRLAMKQNRNRSYFYGVCFGFPYS